MTLGSFAENMFSPNPVSMFHRGMGSIKRKKLVVVRSTKSLSGGGPPEPPPTTAAVMEPINQQPPPNPDAKYHCNSSKTKEKDILPSSAKHTQHSSSAAACHCCSCRCLSQYHHHWRCYHSKSFPYCFQTAACSCGGEYRSSSSSSIPDGKRLNTNNSCWLQVPPRSRSSHRSASTPNCLQLTTHQSCSSSSSLHTR